VCAFACFVEIRNTEAWNNNPWLPLWDIMHPNKGIPSHIMGDVVLRWKLPHPRLREFSFLIDMKMT
jgi:hypothetical protein